ncbi:hypothetical protein GCM10010387_11000 [Streptomyces inusitatus]|uniref:Uncharacterized protein n=1 Tax=Streptomyces inusitatus TaxID=68221 RepID=A0A918PRW1_9ACTN|nr:hypothetical protein GCM10010387_11000 [Streptomyces inusitatus]
MAAEGFEGSKDFEGFAEDDGLSAARSSDDPDEHPVSASSATAAARDKYGEREWCTDMAVPPVSTPAPPPEESILQMKKNKIFAAARATRQEITRGDFTRRPGPPSGAEHFRRPKSNPPIGLSV